jgi:release factor glutamine methyltransferase
MTLREALGKTIQRLEKAGIPDARLDAEYLVAEAAGLPRLQLPLKLSAVLNPAGQKRLEGWLRERLERRPLAYVLGEQPFMHLTLRVAPSVLIPRPETELLVEEAVRVLDSLKDAVVADIGTGSGNIALALAAHPCVKELHAVDISEAALAVARENALRNPVKTPVRWHQGDLLAPLMERDIAADMIIANLPYVRTGELPTLSPEVRWEPALALDGGRDGLAYVYQLIDQAEAVLKPEGTLVLEIGSDQGHALLKHLETNPLWTNTRLLKDLAGLPRIVRTQKGALVGSFNH